MAVISIERHISMGHRLPSYNGICSSLHGHNVRVKAEIVTVGFLDFKQVDNWLKAILEPLDHAMVLFHEDPAYGIIKDIPNQRIVLLSVEPTTEALAQLVMNELASYAGVNSVTVFETDKYQATCTETDDVVKRIEA